VAEFVCPSPTIRSLGTREQKQPQAGLELQLNAPLEVEDYAVKNGGLQSSPQLIGSTDVLLHSAEDPPRLFARGYLIGPPPSSMPWYLGSSLQMQISKTIMLLLYEIAITMRESVKRNRSQPTR
jgi:hypothetical protein